MIVSRIAADFQLEVSPACSQSFVTKARDLLVAEANPADRRGVSGKAIFAEVFETILLACAAFFEQSDGFIAGESIVDVMEVDEAGDAFGLHLGQQLPNRFIFNTRVEIPYRVDESSGCKVDDTLFRAEPAKLRIAGELTAEGAQIVRDGAERATGYVTGQIADGIAAEIVAVTAGKGEAETAQALVRFEDAVGSGIVGIFIDRVRADAFPRSGKAQVDDADVGNAEISQGRWFSRVKRRRTALWASWDSASTTILGACRVVKSHE